MLHSCLNTSATKNSPEKMVARLGLEPRQTVSETVVLPITQSGINENEARILTQIDPVSQPSLASKRKGREYHI
jgi:hypothetical protein